ncbi:MAG: glycosyltransferase family 4 protein [Actinomycetota bacterium]
MKLAVVTPRYGAEVTGGAELAARLLSSRLAATSSWEVEALTTCARDATTWANEYAPGTEQLDGVAVHRFPTSRTRRAGFDRMTRRIVYRRRQVTLDDQVRWMEDQGPLSPALIAAIRESDADVVAFHPYLYHPTVVGLPYVAGRAVLHPAAHDEAPLRLPIVRDVFLAAAALGFWSEPERRLVQRRFPIAARRQAVIGLGVEPAAGDPDAARQTVGLGDRPFLLCLGRVDDGKGARVLSSCFTAYKQRRPGPLALVFAGPVVDAPVAHPDVILAGTVDEATKWGLLRAAEVLVSPSAYESLSIVLLEGWSVGAPALVNALCDVTAEHVGRSGGGLTFGGYSEFEVALDHLLGSADLRAEMGERGAAYVAQHYRWTDLVERYAAFLETVSTRGVRR